ncbi:ribosomal protein L32 [Streptomyces calvus]
MRHPAAFPHGLSRPSPAVRPTPTVPPSRKETAMAVPKRKMSRSNTRHRRAQWKASTPNLVPVTVDGVTHRVPQHLVRAYQRGLLRPED